MFKGNTLFATPHPPHSHWTPPCVSSLRTGGAHPTRASTPGAVGQSVSSGGEDAGKGGRVTVNLLPIQIEEETQKEHSVDAKVKEFWKVFDIKRTEKNTPR